MTAYQAGMRYLHGRWAEVRLRSYLSNEQLTQLAEKLFAQACADGMSAKTVIHYGLDNPFMHDHARATLASQARRDLAVRRASRGC